ncbi:MAG: zf-HC2 domain-containing protein, partial [Armatimonadetes bacterium]|nr:zf-HC2 domain-containing protein [Armatimonadota bacterium]
MKCDRCQEQFTDYLEGGLPAPQREQMAAHLRQCPDCAGELEAFRRTVAALRGLEAVAPPTNLLSRINRAVAAQAQPVQPRFRVSWQHLGAAAAAAALVVGFVTVFSYQRIGPVSERLGGQVAGTVQRHLERATPAGEKLAGPAALDEEKAVVEALAVTAPPQKTVPTETGRDTKEASGGEQPAGGGEPGLTGADAAKYAAVPEIEAWEEDAAAPGGAGEAAALAAGGRRTLGGGPYGRSSTPLDMANVEAGARVVITPPSLEKRIVGEPVEVGVSIQPQASVESAVVRVQPQGSLRLVDERPIIYQGPLPADEPK